MGQPVVWKWMCLHRHKCALWLTYQHSSPPRDSGGQTWRCSGCTRRSVWTWWASVSVKKQSQKHKKLASYCWSLYEWCIYCVREAFTKQVLQNMLRSRLPVSASSTIVWRKETRNKSRIFFREKKKGRPEMRQKHEWTTEQSISPRSIWHGNKRPSDSVHWGWDFQLSDHTGGSADSWWSGTKATMGLTVGVTY